MCVYCVTGIYVTPLTIGCFQQSFYPGHPDIQSVGRLIARGEDLRVLFCFSFDANWEYYIDSTLNSRYTQILQYLATTWRLSCKPLHAQHWQYPDWVDKRLFSPIGNVTTAWLQKSLSLSPWKQTRLKRYHDDLLRHLVAFSKFEWFMSSDPKIKNFGTHWLSISRSISIRTGNEQVNNLSCVIVPSMSN